MLRYWLLVVDKKTILLVVGKKVDFVTRRKEEDQDQDQEEGKHLNHI